MEDALRDIASDLDMAGDNGKGAEIFALVRYADGSFDIWSSATLSALDRVGAMEAIKQHLLIGDGDGS